MIRQEVVVAYFVVLLHRLTEEIEWTHENIS